MAAPKTIIDLVDRFAEHKASYKSSGYYEAHVRKEFIDPLFRELEWDMDNSQGFAEQYKEVIHEDALKLGGLMKAPDYCFRVGGTRKFFVEAKRPSTNIKEDPDPAYQLRRYAWSAKLPLSILTDFEELAVYDCRVKPNKGDKASVARTLYLTFDQLSDRWDELAGVFSKGAILRGSFDKYAFSKKLKKGTAEVDDEFLEDIQQWRASIARNLALRNPSLSEDGLNLAVQQIIDRIVFLRICEDRGIESYGQLQAIANGSRTYARLLEHFAYADRVYNSGLFHFEHESSRASHRDTLTPSLDVDDVVLKKILSSLYYPESPYEFSVMPLDILGHVYERLLGSEIRLTPKHRARLEEKPDVRKAGGVYYTPTYVVAHVVKNSLGRLLEDKTPAQAASIKLLDPACGSGTFLIESYRYLLDWHRDRYIKRDPKKHARGQRPKLFRSQGGAWQLTTHEKKRILLNSIHGVDIDSQAVEVTKLSLLLCVLEGETDESIGRTLKLFKERALPDLDDNIRCGNAVVDFDYYDRTASLLNLSDGSVNPFSWSRSFGHVLSRKQGGFDVVLGNPPWGQKEIFKDDELKSYIREKYNSVAGIFDLFRPFVEKGIDLTRPRGAFAMVLPDIVLLKDYQQTRKLMLDELAITNIDWWGMAFRDATIDCATIVGTKRRAPASHRVSVVVHEEEESLSHEIPQKDFRENPRFIFNLYLTPEKRRWVEQLSVFPRLGDYFEAHEGVHSGNMRKELFVEEQLDESCKPLVLGRKEIAPYKLSWDGRYIRLSVVPERRTKRRYANVGKPEWHEREKLLVRRTGDQLIAVVDRDGYFVSNNLFLVVPLRQCWLSLDGLCALLNSDLMTRYFQTIEPRRGRVFSELKIKHLVDFPLPRSDRLDSQDEGLNELGYQRTAATAEAAAAPTPSRRVRAERAIEEIDSRIERLVERLLG